jgi:anti-sigma regulatory factor (Ser/Thr protein kinase)
VTRVDDVVLAASELVTNAIVHADTDIELAIHLDDQRVRIEVTDGSLEPVVKRATPVEQEGGLGLVIVETLAARWGTEVVPGHGKCVWCEICRR